MTRRTVVSCDASWFGFPCRGALPLPPDVAVNDRLGVAGWTRRQGRDLCPAHSRRPDAVPCTKQVTYADEREAAKALTRLMRVRAVQGSGPITKMEERSHWCEQHDGYHLTSKRHEGR